MDNNTIFEELENPRRGRQARNLTKNVPKIIDLKSSSEQVYIGMCRSKGYRIFAPFWSENRYRFCPFWSGITCGLESCFQIN